MNFIVETKKEYTINLINIVTPFLYDGLVSIYEEAVKVSSHKEELKTFQLFLQRIPSWNEEMIKAESKRIMLDSNCSDILDDLLKAVIKANIIVLSNTSPDSKNHQHINFNIDFNKFIHFAYIESAKALFQNPFLFLHNISDNEKSRNRKETLEIIKVSIEETIRKLIPLDLVLKKYLGSSFEIAKIKIDTAVSDNSLSKNDKENLIHLLKTDDVDKKDSTFKHIKETNDLASESYIPSHFKIFDSYEAKK